MTAAPACRRWRLGNGLRLVHVQGPQTDLVAVHVAYRAGAADEPQEAKGLAHLTEHLMYAGSRALPGSHLRHLDAVGASDLNGRTGLDSTHYFQTVPRAALEFALYAEAGRMAAPLLRARDFQLQRRVVLEELQQRRAQAEQRVAEHWQACLYPAPHPYHRGSGGDAQQLATLSLHTLRCWQQRYYQPGNAVLVLAGDLDFAQARALAQRYFAAVPVAAGRAPAPKRLRSRATAAPVLQEALSAPRLYQAWHLPPREAAQHYAAFIWLQQLLVQQLQAQQPATVPLLRVHFEALRLGAALSVELHHAVAANQEWLRGQWQRLLQQGFSPEALHQAGAALAQQHRLRCESLQGLAALAAGAELQRGDARLAFAADMAAAPDAAVLHALLRRYASDAPLQLQVQPASFIHRAAPQLPSARRAVHPMPRYVPVRVQGEDRLEAWLAARKGSGLLAGSLLLPAGAHHQRRTEAGLAALSARLLAQDESLRAHAQRWQLRIEAHAAYTQLRWCCASAETPALLRTLVQAVQRHERDEASFAAQRQQQYEMLLAQQSDIAAHSQTLLEWLLWKRPPLLGTPATLARLDRESLQQFRAHQYRPGGAQLLLAGDPGGLALDEALAAAFAPWAGVARPATSLAFAPLRQERLHLQPNADARAVLLTIAWPLSPATPRSEALLQLADQLLAGSFGSRLNLRLREQLGWTYGVSSAVLGESPQRYYQIQCWLPAAQARAAQEEVRAALRWLAEQLSAAQLRRAQDRLLLSAPGRVERSERLLELLQRHVRLGFGETPWRQQYQTLAAITPDELRTWAGQLLVQPALCLVRTA